jgi:hypothetical protein
MLVLTVFGCLALLSGQAKGIGSQAVAAQAPVTLFMPAVSSAEGAGGRVLAAPADSDPDEWTVDPCKQYSEQRDFLPLNRWTSFNLFAVDNAWIFKTQMFVSMIASFMFGAAAMAWRIIGNLMGFSYTFDMVCSAAGPINSVGRTMSLYAAWFLIPAWLFVLLAVVRRWSSGQRGGPASAVRLIMVFLTATGMIFFVGDQSDQHRHDPTSPYTLPWMAETVQGWVGTASASLLDLQRIGRLDGGTTRNPVFYDDQKQGGAGKVTCAALDDALYNKYNEDNASSSVSNGRDSMVQLSKIWEMTLVRSWETAQFGEGTIRYPSPAHAACRLLESHASVDSQKKFEAYDLATGNPAGTTTRDTYRGFYIDPPDGEQVATVAWGACKGSDDGLAGNGVIPEWQDASKISPESACALLFSGQKSTNVGNDFKAVVEMDKSFYFNGKDELNSKLGKCVTIKDSCYYAWQFASGWLGKNESDRLTQGLMSVIVAFVFLFVLGPMAIGQAVSSAALAGLVMLIPVTLLLVGLGLPQGTRLLKLTGAAAFGDFYFSLALTALTMFIDTTFQAISVTIGTNAPNFFEQVAQGTAPLVALYLFRRLSKILGMGDISTTTGALGFAGAAVLRTSGDRALARNAGGRVSQALGQLGAGRMQLGALDERSLQRRLLNNAATRSMAAAAGRGAHRVTRPVTDWAKDRAESFRAGMHRGSRALARRAASGSPGQRARVYAGLTAGMAGLTVVAPPAVLATLPLMAFTGGAAALRGAQATGGWAGRRLRGIQRMFDHDGIPGLKAPDAATAIPMAKSARAGLREADDWHRNIIRVNNAEDQRRLMARHAEDGLNMLRARQWGAGHAGGLNNDFKGFVNDEEKARAIADMADRTGLRTDQLIVGDHGLALPVPVMVDKRSGQRVFAEGTSIDQAAHPVHYLDKYTLRRQMIDGVEENDDQYVARLTAQLRERGYVTGEGEFVDVFRAHGFDTRVPEVRQRVAAFVSGSRDEELSKIMITARRSEDAAVGAARDWARVSMPIAEVREARDAAAVNAVMEAARTEIGDFGQIRVEMPDGTSSTAGQVRTELEQHLTGMMGVVAEAQDLHDAWTAIPAEDFVSKLNDLTRKHQEHAQDVDRLSVLLRDAADASRAARGLSELRVKLADPNIAVDTTALSQAASQLTSTYEQERREWHETVDRLVGAISRPPTGADVAQEVADALVKLQDTMNIRISNEIGSNGDVIRRLEEMQEALENNMRLTRVDPRLTASRPVDMRKVLHEMYRREMSRD